MKPLSTRNYLRANLKKTVVVSISIGLAILFIYILSITIKTVDRSQVWVDLNPTKLYSIVLGTNETGIQEEVIQKIKAHPSTERVIGVKGVNTYYTHIMSGTMWVGIWFLNEKELPPLIENLHLELKEGRLPRPGTQELVLHELLLRNKGLKLGDRIGNSIEPTEAIPGTFEIVGVFSGESITGFGALEAGANEVGLQRNVLMVFHKQEEREASNLFLKEILPKDTIRITYERIIELIADNNRSLNSVLNITLIVAVFVLSVAIANSTYLHFFERKKEYALLRALGYSRGWILGKAGQEIMITSFVGLCLGGILTIVTLIFYTNFVLIKVGAPYQLFDLRAMMNGLTIVVAAIVACLIPVWMFLGKIDVIETIEGGE